MKISFIGAGKVGTVFGWYLKSKGLDVLGYYSKTQQSAENAARETGTKLLDLDEIMEHSHLIFVTTPDSSIEKVCNQICQEYPLQSHQTIIHMSGALKSEILAKAKEKGANIFSLHPMQSFADIQKAKQDIGTTFLTYEGYGNKDNLTQILHKLGNPYREIKSEDKTLYHAAACISSNYLVTLTKIATQLFEQIGFDEKEAIKVLAPLIKGTINNIEELGVESALTGPIIRGDVDTISGHLDGLKDQQSIKSIYCKLGIETLKIAKKRGLHKDHIHSIINLLDGSEGNE